MAKFRDGDLVVITRDGSQEIARVNGSSPDGVYTYVRTHNYDDPTHLPVPTIHVRLVTSEAVIKEWSLCMR